MAESTEILRSVIKSGHYIERAFHKNGPKSYMEGVGALMKVVAKAEGTATSEYLLDTLGYEHDELEAIIAKAEEKGYVEVERPGEEKHNFTVKLTEEGSTIAERRFKANDRTADEILEGFNEEERNKLLELSQRIIATCEAKGVELAPRRSHHHWREDGHSHVPAEGESHEHQGEYRGPHGECHGPHGKKPHGGPKHPHDCHGHYHHHPGSRELHVYLHIDDARDKKHECCCKHKKHHDEHDCDHKKQHKHKK